MTTAARNFAAELLAAREAGDWAAHARIWDERNTASVDADEAVIADKFEVIDRLDGDKVVAKFPTHRKALNYTNRAEPTPAGAPLGYKSFDGQTHGWRYLIRPIRKSQYSATGELQ